MLRGVFVHHSFVLTGVFVQYSVRGQGGIRSVFVRGQGVFVQYSFVVRGYSLGSRSRSEGIREGRKVGGKVGR